jgi:hypothetical protein
MSRYEDYSSTGQNTSTMMIDQSELMAKAAAWMHARRWKR